jgi:hypothetical protein
VFEELFVLLLALLEAEPLLVEVFVLFELPELLALDVDELLPAEAEPPAPPAPPVPVAELLPELMLLLFEPPVAEEFPPVDELEPPVAELLFELLI